MRNWFLFITSLCFAPASAHAHDVLLIGDSQAGGLSSFLSDAFEGIGSNVRITYHNGWSTRMFRERGHLGRAHLDVDVAIIVLGNNNFDTNVDTYRREVTWLIDQLYAYGVQRIVWIGPCYSTNPEVEARKEATRGLLRQILHDHNVEYVDSVEMTRYLGRRPDRVHFTSRSYRRWAARILATLAQGR